MDLQRSSPAPCLHVAAALMTGDGEQRWMPVGVAHAFCTLEPDAEVLYKGTVLNNAEADHRVEPRRIVRRAPGLSHAAVAGSSKAP